MADVILIGCGAAKLQHPAPARELYTSALFRLSLRYAERADAQVYVVSAKHGVVELDQVLQPYDLSLAALSPLRRALWGADVLVDLRRRLDEPINLVLLAGEVYAAHLLPPGDWGWTVQQPLARLQIGERLRWLKAADAV